MNIKEIKKSRSIDNKNNIPPESFFGIQGRTIIGENTTNLKKQMSFFLLQSPPQKKRLQYEYEKKSTPSTEVVLPTKSPPSILLKGKKNKGKFTQFNKTVNNTIKIINKITFPSSPPKSILNTKKDFKKRKSVKFLTTRPSLLDDKEEKNNNHQRKAFYPRTVKLSKANEVNDIIKTISNKKKESKANCILEIDQFPKCHCIKDLGAIKGFSALTHSNQNNINNDKLSIFINKNVSLMNSDSKIINLKKEINFFGLYHGINGDFTSSYLKNNIHTYIFKHKESLTKPEIAIGKGHKEMEKELMSSYGDKTRNNGSCSLIVYELEGKLYISNVGNSRCILSSNYGQQIHNLSLDHNPFNINEAQRIKSASFQIHEQGYVKIARIIPSGLHVTRILGFSNAKNGVDMSTISQTMTNFQTQSNIKEISNHQDKTINILYSPEIFKLQMNDEMDFILMGSEGILNYISNRELMLLAYTSIKNSLYTDKSYENMLDDITAAIAKEAVNKNSQSNLSIILLALNNLDKIYKEKNIQKVNEAIALLSQSTHEYNDIYPYALNLEVLNSKCKSPRKKSNNHFAVSKSLKDYHNESNDTSHNNAKQIKEKQSFRNSLECSLTIGADVPKKPKEKKKKKNFFCLCWF